MIVINVNCEHHVSAERIIGIGTQDCRHCEIAVCEMSRTRFIFMDIFFIDGQIVRDNRGEYQPCGFMRLLARKECGRLSHRSPLSDTPSIVQWAHLKFDD
jgi:hypothetical protein